MLIGEYKHTIDAKKRLALPAKFRKELGRTVIITKGLENCLFVFSQKEWKVFSEKLAKLPLRARGFSRIMLAGAMETNLDKLGRVLIPDYLKDFGGLKKNIIICGLSDRLEIWDERNWQEYKNKVEKDVGSFVSELGEIGI